MSNKAGSKQTPMTRDALSRVHSARARANGGSVPKGDVVGRMQRTVARSTASKK